MRITYKGDYALKAVLDLALHHGKEVVTIHEIAGHINAPIKFLEQVLLALKNGGFIVFSAIYINPCSQCRQAYCGNYPCIL